MKRKLLLCAVAASALGATACHPPTPQEIAKTTADQTSALVSEAGQSVQTINSMSSLASLSSGYRTASGGTCSDANPCQGPQAPPQDDFNQQMTRLATLLQERVFIDKNLESRDAFSATFKINGADICTDGTYTPSQYCVDQVDKSDMHVKAWPQLGGGMNLQILVGPSRSELIAFELSKTSLAATSDLAQTKKAVEFIDTATGTSQPDLPQVLDGKLELKLQKNGTQDFTLSYSVLSDVHVQWTDSSGNTRTFQTASKSPLVAWRLEAPKKRLTFQLDLGKTQYTGPYKPDISTNGLAGTKLTVLLSGLSWQFVAEDGKDQILIGNVGLGDGQSSVQLDDKKLFTADLNPSLGRHFDLAISKDTDGLPIFQFSPGFDLTLGYFLQALMVDQDVASRIPSYALNDTYRLQFNGSKTPTFKVLAANSATGFTGGLQILSGNLSFSVSDPNVNASVTAGAGQCLVGRTPGPSDHPIVGALSSQSCP